MWKISFDFEVAKGLSLLMEYRWSTTSKASKFDKKLREYEKKLWSIMGVTRVISPS